MSTNLASDFEIERPDGRRVGVHDTGGDGPVVVFCHPAPGSRRLDPDPTVTAAAGVRLVTVDRPGYGRSTPWPTDAPPPTIPTFADDVVAAIDHLGTRDVAVAGWSAGGRIAVAVAARQPELIRAVAVIGAPAPDEEVRWIPDENRALIVALRADPDRATAVVAAQLASMTADPAVAVASLGDSAGDRAALDADPVRRDRLEAMLAEAFRAGAAGLAADIVSYTVIPWGFDPSTVTARTSAFYGDDDAIVTTAHGQWYADRIPGATLRVMPGVGHLVALTAWREVLDSLA